MIRAVKKILVIAGCIALGACGKNTPVAPLVNDSGIQYRGVPEAQTADVLFSPTSPTQFTTGVGAPNYWGGAVKYSWGGASTVLLSDNATHTAADSPSTMVILRSPGIGGPNGDYQNDYYLHWEGYKGTNTSVDYNSLIFYFNSGGQNSAVDISRYRGFIFYARGNGKFGLQLAATGLKTGQAGPYTDFNYYEFVFGDQISSNSWRQVQVNFSDMLQLYGASTDKSLVLKGANAFQIVQEVPITQNFWLDMDYIRFF